MGRYYLPLLLAALAAKILPRGSRLLDGPLYLPPSLAITCHHLLSPLLQARMLEHALRLFDIVLFLDSDAVVWDTSITVEHMVQKHMGDSQTAFAMTQDCVNATWCWDEDKVNAGVILARRSPMTSRILTHWMNPDLDKDCREFKYKHPREQQCLNYLLNKHYNHAIRRVHVNEMNGTNGTWIRHFMGSTSELRNEAMAGLLRERLTAS